MCTQRCFRAAVLALLVCLQASFVHAARSPLKGMRVYENGRYRWYSGPQLERVDREVGHGHQPWRTECSLVALLATRPNLPGDPAKWSEVHYTKPGFAALTYGDLPFPTVSYDVNWHDARWTRVTVIADIQADSLPKWARKITLRRTRGGVYWVTEVRKIMPER